MGKEALNIEALVKEKYLVIDGAMGTEIQKLGISSDEWSGYEGCGEWLCLGAPEKIKQIHKAYLKAGADIIKTNAFGSMPWVLDEYNLGDKTYELAKKAAELAKEACNEYAHIKPRFTAGAFGPGTKLPSLGHISYDEMFDGYKITVNALIDGGVDCFLLETCQDPLQIKAALDATSTVLKERNLKLPILVSATIELNGTMLIGTNADTLAVILEPYEIFSLGFNCGVGPEQIEPHIHALSNVWSKNISVHANAGLPQNRGGYTFYPMGPEEFAARQTDIAKTAGVAILGGCCGTTPQHIWELSKALDGKKPVAPHGKTPKAVASLFDYATLRQEPAPLLIGERSNATGSKAFRDILLAADYDKTLDVGNQQVRGGAHVLDVSVAFAGRDESADMKEVVARYSNKIALPLMPDSTQTPALEIALKLIGGRAIINSANFEDGEEKFDAIANLAKRFGAVLVCLVIDEQGMAKTLERKLEVAERLYQRAITKHGLRGDDLVFDMLTFTVGSGDPEYFTSAIDTIDAIREFAKKHPEVGFTLGISNVSFGLAKHAREILNAVFLHHCVHAGLTTAIVNAALTMPYYQISEEDRVVCENLLFNKRDNGVDPLAIFIEKFSDAKNVKSTKDDLEGLNTRAKLHKLLLLGDKGRMLELLPVAKDEIEPNLIVNEILIGAMKEVGELFGDGKMQLPFVLQSAETMKSAVDFLQPFLPKSENKSQTTLVLGTVKGDVHDVGKNLVDIILSNNGYKVVNIGIKAELPKFLEALKDSNANAIGMSGLLVKSTQVMLENLKEMDKMGINLPVLLGGAALNLRFIEEFCYPAYNGPIVYCKDAFDAITALQQIESGEIKAGVPLAPKLKPKEQKEEKESVFVEPTKEDSAKAPFIGRKVWHLSENEKLEVFEWINQNLLFKERWGYKAGKMDKNEYQKQLDEVVKPAYERIKNQLLSENLFDPVVIYGYFKAKKQNDSLIVYNDNKEYLFEFPRQSATPQRCLSDYFNEDDFVPFSVVSSGLKLPAFEKKLYDDGNFAEYHLVHGLSSELAEALAEMLHAKIRIELGLNEDGKPKLKGYVGKRYSFGYPACPDLEQNKAVFELLKPEEFGVVLSETCLIEPEASTSAIIVKHSEAEYFTI